MSPPINLPDGTEVSEVILPDGAAASEVIAPDGNTVFSAIPDTQVSRDPDNDSFGASSSNKLGIRIRTSQQWPEIDGEISANTANAEDAILRRVSDGTVKDTVDISALSSGDVFTFDSANLGANTEYDILLTASSSFTSGFDNTPQASYTSSDGNLEIIDGANNNGVIGSNDMHGVVTVGNLP